MVSKFHSYSHITRHLWPGTMWDVSGHRPGSEDILPAVPPIQISVAARVPNEANRADRIVTVRSLFINVNAIEPHLQKRNRRRERARNLVRAVFCDFSRCNPPRPLSVGANRPYHYKVLISRNSHARA